MKRKFVNLTIKRKKFRALMDSGAELNIIPEEVAVRLENWKSLITSSWFSRMDIIQNKSQGQESGNFLHILWKGVYVSWMAILALGVECHKSCCS
ncbi:retroviral aspartyl protease family protein [Puccinia sorghi]|uniref:Retroviral aspartyl protease family protein n=1 Tax=Puccinia sorghi TaxID=27349 RepID=A0A0L6UMM1_9BASI|nr:retroviral aspartyl protease family protein [Puccinia sorghi]